MGGDAPPAQDHEEEDAYYLSVAQQDALGQEAADRLRQATMGLPGPSSWQFDVRDAYYQAPAFIRNLLLPRDVLDRMGQVKPHECAKPGCTRQDPTTMQCARCRAVRYHCKSCQIDHRHAHKQFCVQNEHPLWDRYTTPI